MNTPNETNTIDLCPVDGAVCDRKCGYQAHGTLKRAKPLEIHLPEDPMDALMCEGCQ